MAEIRNPKGYYYNQRDRYMRITKQVGYKLDLATTAEDDVMLWEKYKHVLDKWRKLRKPDGVNHRDDIALRREHYLRPEFNDAYVDLTRQLSSLYAKRNAAKTKQERFAVDEMIRIVKRKRSAATTFYDRETGERVAI